MDTDWTSNFTWDTWSWSWLWSWRWLITIRRRIRGRGRRGTAVQHHVVAINFDKAHRITTGQAVAVLSERVEAQGQVGEGAVVAVALQEAAGVGDRSAGRPSRVQYVVVAF